MKKLFTIVWLVSAVVQAQSPKLVVVIVIDQLSKHYLQQLKPHLTGGLHFLDSHGVNYTNAFYKQSPTGTGAGHTILSTGTYGSFHGIINNKWYNENHQLVACDDDTTGKARVFAPDGLYSYGKSAQQIMVDGLSDQLVLHSYPHARTDVWSLSLKSRASISMASRLGKAVWLDTKSGNFTSSKAYFEELPTWIRTFNQAKGLATIKSYAWKPLYEAGSEAYKFPFIDHYDYSNLEQLMGKKIDTSHEHAYELLAKTPVATTRLLELAQECIIQNAPKKSRDRLVLWLSLSGLDKVGHPFGPYSREALDTLYRMDQEIGQFINFIYSRFDPSDVLFALTADHGVFPIVELLKQQGYNKAYRVNATQLMLQVNDHILKKHGIADILVGFVKPQFYLNKTVLQQSTKKQLAELIADIKDFMEHQPGIRKVWTFDELSKASFQPFDLDSYLQRQLFKGRSGDLILSIFPFVDLDKAKMGTGHTAPYAYDTQVPLIFYQAGRFEKKQIRSNVSMTQFPVTLAELLSVPRPSASIAEVLPGLDYNPKSLKNASD